MDFKERKKKIEHIWNKIQRLNEIFEEENHVSAEELSLVKKYLHQIEEIYADNGNELPHVHVISIDIPEEKNQEKEPIAASPSIPVVEEVMAPVEEVAVPVSVANQDYIIHDNTPFPPLIEKTTASNPVPMEEKSINERFIKSEHKDLHTRIAKKTYESISLADKFLYIGELFANNPVDYAAALSKMDTCSSYAEAIDKLKGEFASKYDWKNKEATLQKFMDMIAARYD